jgi:hypothetical protein
MNRNFCISKYSNNAQKKNHVLTISNLQSQNYHQHSYPTREGLNLSLYLQNL